MRNYGLNLLLVGERQYTSPEVRIQLQIGCVKLFQNLFIPVNSASLWVNFIQEALLRFTLYLKNVSIQCVYALSKKFKEKKFLAF